jgi:hypothetical protein
VGRSRSMSDRLAWTRFIETGEISPPKNKYNARKVEVNGRVFDSQREANRAIELQWMEATGQIYDLEYQVRLEVISKQPGMRATYYFADFVYRLPSGEKVIEDAKGVKTKEFRIKKKLVFQRYGIAIKEV